MKNQNEKGKHTNNKGKNKSKNRKGKDKNGKQYHNRYRTNECNGGYSHSGSDILGSGGDRCSGRTGKKKKHNF